MGTKLASEVIEDAAGLYNDPNFDRIDEEPGGDNAHNWLDFLNAGQSQIVIYRPQANIDNIIFPLVEGTRQEVPKTSIYKSTLSPTSCCTDPDDDEDATTGWTAFNSVISSDEGGETGYRLKIMQNGGSPSARTSVSVVKGKTYKLTLYMAAPVGQQSSVYMYYWTVQDYELELIAVDGQGDDTYTKYEYEFTAQYTDSDFRIYLLPVDTTAYFDNVLFGEVAFTGECIQLVDVVRNMGTDGETPGNAITIIDRSTLDETFPGWHSQSADSVVRNFTFDERDPDRFWVTPPQPASSNGYVEIIGSCLPDDISSSSDVITLSDIYYHVLIDYLLYRAYLIDSDSSQIGLQKAVAHWNQFVTGIDRKDLVNKMISPNVKAFTDTQQAGG